jgi:WD40 repeat protein
MYHPIALVAGDGNVGSIDGDFNLSRFKRPNGLAAHPDGTRLFVADTKNHRVRVVHLRENNRVTTLTGLHSGHKDGKLGEALFNQPRGMVFLPNDQIVVNDSGNSVLRLLDLASGTVSTLLGPNGEPLKLPGVAQLAYHEADKGLYLTQPAAGTLCRYDLKTSSLTTLLQGKTEVPNPNAICSDGKSLYVADAVLTDVIRLEIGPKNEYTLTHVVDVKKHTFLLAATASTLYALQDDKDAPMARLYPHYQPVSFFSPWGDPVPEPAKYIPHLIKLEDGASAAWTLDPTEPRRFFIAHAKNNIIIAHRDIACEDPVFATRNSTGLDDYAYPTQKPTGVFRVLLVGDSRIGMTYHLPFKAKDQPPMRQTTVSKQLEFELNFLASLEDLETRFEVLNLFKPGRDPLFLWPTYEMPKVVERFDIDLVVIVQPHMADYGSYFHRPLTPEGIPTKDPDPEYAAKPASERMPTGELRRFFELCQANHMVHVENQNFIFDLTDKDPTIYSMMIQLGAKPLEILNQKVARLHPASGRPPRIAICYTTTGGLNYLHPFNKDLWRKISEKAGFPYMDLSGDMQAFRSSAYPISEMSGNDHFDPNGARFFARLLGHRLIKDGLVPWHSPLRENPGKKTTKDKKRP